MMSDITFEIKKNIQNGDFYSAIKLLVEFTRKNENRFQNEAILYSSAFQSIRESERKGVLGIEEIKLEKRRLASSILDLVDMLDQDLGRKISGGDSSREIRALQPPIEENSGTSARKADEQRTRIFISYSHKDREWLERIKHMLNPAIRGHKIDIWDDTRIQPGSNWRNEIQEALAITGVAVLMVSANFLASDFISEHELPPLLERAEDKGIKIIWIYLSDCMYELTEIEKYQAIHDVSKPLESLSVHEMNLTIKKICSRILSLASYAN
ncbi:MAG: TIR domain-containing protein [Cyanobacteria bacterium J06649_11]